MVDWTLATSALPESERFRQKKFYTDRTNSRLKGKTAVNDIYAFKSLTWRYRAADQTNIAAVETMV